MKANTANVEEDGILNNRCRFPDGGCDSSSDGGNREEDYDDHEYEDPTTGRRIGGGGH